MAIPKKINLFFSFQLLLSLLLFINTIQAQVLYKANEETKYYEVEINKYSRLQSFTSDPRANNIDIYYTRFDLTLNPDTLFVIGNIETSFLATKNIDTLFFDLQDSMKVDSVVYHNTSLNFIQPMNNSFCILLPQQLVTGTKDSIRVYYKGVPVGDGFGGFEKGIHDSTQFCLFNLSEPYSSRNWWPCKQSLTDKIDSIDIILHHPDGYKAASNGLRISETSSAGWTTTHWKHNYPIAPYLIGVAVAYYSVYEDTVHFDSGD